MEKMNILIGCLSFKELTGSELYVFELAKGLKKLGHDVSIISPMIGNPLIDMANELYIPVHNINYPPNENFDLIHCQHKSVTMNLISMYPNIKKICTIHSEVTAEEHPVIHESIHRYVAIRPSIKDMLINTFNINEKNIATIYNPIDSDRFNLTDTKNLGYVLFVGSLEHLRAKPLFDISEYCLENNKELWIVGKNHSNYLPLLLTQKHVKYFPETNEIEKFVKECHETAGILLGRTTIEGWLCGKSGWIYDVDSFGNILNKNLHEIPSDVNKFKSDNVIKEIIEEYKNMSKK
jgi:glycosyltransferase involved in cell wall biosynthesis